MLTACTVHPTNIQNTEYKKHTQIHQYKRYYQILVRIPAHLRGTAPRNTACTERLHAKGFLCQKNPGILPKICKKGVQTTEAGDVRRNMGMNSPFALHLKIYTYGIFMV